MVGNDAAPRDTDLQAHFLIVNWWQCKVAILYMRISYNTLLTDFSRSRKFGVGAVAGKEWRVQKGNRFRKGEVVRRQSDCPWRRLLNNRFGKHWISAKRMNANGVCVVKKQ